MKKLNNTELRVLAEKIEKQLKLEAAQAQEETNELADKQNLAVARTALRQIKRLGPLAKSVLNTKCGISTLDELTEQDILIRMRPRQEKIRYIGYTATMKEILDALIIGQITSPSIEALCNNVAQQFVVTP